MQDLRNALYAHLQHMPPAVLHRHPHRRDPVSTLERRRRRAVGGHRYRVERARQRRDDHQHADRDARALGAAHGPVVGVDAPLPLAHGEGGPARREVAISTQKTLADLTAITEETLSVSGILLSKSFGRQRHEIGRFREENERLTGFQIRQTMIGRSFFAVVGHVLLDHARARVPGGGVAAVDRSDRDRCGHDRRVHDPAVPVVLPDRLDASGLDRGPLSLALFDRIFEYLDLRHDIQDAPNAVTLDPTEVRGELLSCATSGSGTTSPGSLRRRRRRPTSRPRTSPRGSGTLDDVSMRIEPGSARGARRPERRRQDDDHLPRASPVRRAGRGSVTIDGGTFGASRSSRSVRTSGW